MKINEKLQLIKKISGLTQEKLAGEIGVSFVTLNSWINERSIPHKKKQDIIDELYKKYTGQKVIPDTELQAKKELIYKKSKNYKNIIQTIRKRQDVHDQFVLSLTYNSNSIEGSTLTENETADILFRNKNISNKSLIENLEAKNHQVALEYLFREIKLNFKIDEDFILKMHAILMNGIRDDAGMYRRHGVRIVAANVPTANYIKVPVLMKEIIIEIERRDFDVLSHVSMVHSKFEKIHPFSDGNGRIGRLIMAAMLLRKNLPIAIIKQEDKGRYYKYLQKSQIEGDLSSLEDFICDSVFDGYKTIK
jgi:Fic family protein